LKIKLIRVIRFSAFLSLGILLLYLSFRGINFKNFINCLRNANYYWVALSLFFAWIAFLSRAYRWNLLIEPLEYKPGLWHSYNALMVGYFANYAFPRIGEITRCAMLTKTNKIPTDKLIGTVIVERVIDLVTLAFVTLIVVFSKADFFGGFLKQQVFNPLLEKLKNVGGNHTILVFSLIFILSLIAIWILWRLRHRFIHQHSFRKVINILYGIVAGLKSFWHMKRRKEFLFHTIIIWLMYWLMTWVIVFSLPLGVTLKPIDGLFLLVVAGLGMSAPVQGGFGACHAITTLALMIYGISHEEGLALAVISHESQMIGIIILGCISLSRIYIISRKQKTNSSENNCI
jgi:glycosyltransferase 2 family protein